MESKNQRGGDMKTCKSCTHWEQWGDEVGECHMLTNQSEKSDRVRVYADSIPINTEADFGCVHYEGKTAEDI
jgi:hypothetical protein